MTETGDPVRTDREHDINARPGIAFHLLLATLLLSVFAPAAQAYYSLSTGTFLQRDPAGHVDGPNLYRYGRSNPLTYTDPMGLRSVRSVVDSHCRTKCKNSGNVAGRPYAKCMNRCRRNLDKQGRFDLWHEHEINYRDWLNDLPDCPCTIEGDCNKPDPDVWNEPTTELHGYHIGATKCMRSKSVNGAANQCCYDENGKLITHGSGSGSADRGAVDYYIHLPRHWREDICPANLGHELDGGRDPLTGNRMWGPASEKYLEARPQVGSDKCPKNP